MLMQCSASKHSRQIATSSVFVASTHKTELIIYSPGYDTHSLDGDTPYEYFRSLNEKR